MHNEAEIKERIRKLLAVVGNSAATEGEVDNALRFATSMMDKYHLEEEDLVEEPVDQWKRVEAATRDRVFVSVGGKTYRWEGHLAMFCAQFVGGVGTYRDPSKDKVARDHRNIVILNEQDEPYKGKRFCFYGIAEDAMMAAELFHELRMTIRAMSRLRWGGCYKKDGGAYAEGFVNGLYTKIVQQTKEEKLLAHESGSRALILIERRNDLIRRKEETAKQWLRKATGIKLQRGYGSPGASGSYEAFREGVTDGKRSDVSALRMAKIGG